MYNALLRRSLNRIMHKKSATDYVTLLILFYAGVLELRDQFIGQHRFWHGTNLFVYNFAVFKE